jgi:hypothetical protein
MVPGGGPASLALSVPQELWRRQDAGRPLASDSHPLYPPDALPVPRHEPHLLPSDCLPEPWQPGQSGLIPGSGIWPP